MRSSRYVVHDSVDSYSWVSVSTRLRLIVRPIFSPLRVFWHVTLPLFDTRPEQIEKLRKQADAIIAQVVDPATEVGARKQLLARAHHDVWEQLPQLRCPTLVCAGRYDGIAPLSNAMALTARIRGARLAVFEGGHSFLLQDRRAPITVARFLREAGV